jgi:hypothetical protein
MSFPASAGVYQIPDVTTDQGFITVTVDNQYANNWNGIILPFIGGFGKEASEQSGIKDNSYYVVSESSDFYTAATDCIGQITFKFNLQKEGDLSTYLIPIKFETNNTSSQYYVRITQPATNFMNQYMIELLNSEQTSLLNTTVAQLGSNSPAYVTFGDNKVKITHVNTLTGILTLWETETGSGVIELPYSYCEKVSMDISGYPYPIECKMKVLDSFEIEKTYDSFPLKIYWLITQIVPDNNQSLYYLFQAVDKIWSLSMGIILLSVSMPCMWLFFAVVCGLGSVVMKGNLNSGIPAGIRTTIKVTIIPAKLVKILIDILAKILTAIKPV